MNRCLIHYIYLNLTTKYQLRKRGFQMKLKFIGLVVCILGSSSVWARRMPVLVCEDVHLRSSSFSVPKGMGAIAHQVYNYSSATLTCPSNAEYVMEKKGIVTCFGSWYFDKGSRPSLAWVEITNDGQKITARSQSNRFYGSVKLDFNCEVKEEEVY